MMGHPSLVASPHGRSGPVLGSSLMARHYSIALLVLVAALVRLPVGAQAGGEVPGAPPAQPPAAAPETVVAQDPVVRDVAGLAAAIDETYGSLREIREMLVRKKLPAELEQRLGEVERQVRALRAE